jgi:hypothetical protein
MANDVVGPPLGASRTQPLAEVTAVAQEGPPQQHSAVAQYATCRSAKNPSPYPPLHLSLARIQTRIRSARTRIAGGWHWTLF